MSNRSPADDAVRRRLPDWMPAVALASLVCSSACGAGSAGPALAPGAVAPSAGERPPAAPLPHDIVAQSALPLHALVGERKLEEPELWDQMASSRVICFGEQHDSPQHHYAQRRALQELAARSAKAQRPLAVGFEMFQRPYQATLSAFVAGSVTEAQFLQDSEYAKRWGFDFALYRPLLLTARELSLAVLALNAPKELTRKIGRSGLAGLEPAERELLPELNLKDADHKAYFDEAMGEHPMPPGAPKLEDMYAAQVVWDETMADTAVRWLAQAGEGSQLIVFAGAGHCHHSAIPARITRRTQLPVLSVSPVLRSELAAYEPRSRYDWLIVLSD